jgi:KDO2-lipid IV(A) lauroyltransferase
MVESLDRMASALLRGVLISVGQLPANVALGLGAGVGWLYGKLGGPRVADARINLAIAFPEWGPEKREAVMVESFANLGRSFAEICLMHGDPSGKLFDRVSIQGREHLAEGREGHPGALILTAHLGSWEFCAAALAHKGLRSVPSSTASRILA